ncbi:hypothetical protein AB4Y36_10275 [Paraburkholderia sp. BR10936]|uniref:hypothetical protein n=1 Tax=Paraburkholderia sp. BR10936 TaxID=3236993 RepID=UPI0034D338FF
MELNFDLKDFEDVTGELRATERQISLALRRAIRRTSSRLKTLATRGLRDELALRRVRSLRKRLRTIRLKGGSGKGFQGVMLWFGLNDMPISWFKGTPKQTATGATFRKIEYPGAFVARSSYASGKTILKRKGSARLAVEEQLFPVQHEGEQFIERVAFVRVSDIFWHEFRRDITARVKYNLGEK